jgi:hypothetical protein
MTSTIFISGTGLKKWKPPTRSGPLAGGGDRGHRQRRGIGGEDAVGTDDVFELLEQCLLDVDVFDDRFDDHLRRSQVFEAGDDFQLGAGGGKCLGRNLALLGQLAERAGHGLAGIGGGAVQGVEHQHADAGLGGDLGDAATHGAGADDADAKRADWISTGIDSLPGSPQSFHQGSVRFRPRT